MACTSPDRGGGATSTDLANTAAPPAVTTTESAVTSTTESTLSTGDLVDPEVREVALGDQTLLVAWADDPSSRSRGLMEVRDLGDLDGMLFDLDEEQRVSFTMRNTLIDLDIYFFDAAGSAVGMLEMVPCEEEPCHSYSIDEPARYALEVPAGSLDFDGQAALDIP